jgi:hypothetical protein
MTPAERQLLTTAAIDWLERLGYVVTFRQLSPVYVTVKAFRESLPVRVAPATFHQRLLHKDCPDFDCLRGPSGRITQLRPHAALVAFCSQSSNKHRRLTGTREVK